MGARIYIQFQFELRVEARSIFNRIAYNLQHFQWPFAPFTYLNLIKCKFCARSVLCECQWVEVWESRCSCEKGGERVEGFINSLRFSGFFEWFIRRWTESISTQLNWSMHLSDTLDDKQTKRFIYSTMSPYSAPWPLSLPLPFPFPCMSCSILHWSRRMQQQVHLLFRQGNQYFTQVAHRLDRITERLS